MRFVDTNILLYAVSTRPEDRAKSEVALSILEGEDLAVSVQVLQEFYVQATRASRNDKLTHEQAAALVEAFLRFPAQATTLDLLRSAVAAKQRFQLSYWDAAVVEAARAQGCDVLLSEDMSHGHDYDGVRVINPFRAKSYPKRPA